VHSLYPYLFKFSFVFVYWYKQPIVSAKQPIVFLVLLFLLIVLANWIPYQLFLEVISFLT